MAIAAVPEYLGKDFSTSSPGMRFGMYYQGWTSVWQKHIPNTKNNEQPSLKSCCSLTNNDKAAMKHLLQRQQANFSAISRGANCLRLEAVSTAPFATGLGNEHPTENGFAFLNPYGLPYLPGSSVKGVLRQAARELALGEWGKTTGWSDETIRALFGPEPGADSLVRGVLTFWDVIPQMKGDSLTVEIMTPHQGEYYRGQQSPHDSGQPIPITFLTVPPGSDFTFYVQCNLSLLKCTAPELETQWQALLNTAFKHAFEWLGFGAKTAVGYGAMENKEALKQAQEQKSLEKLKESGISVGSSAWPNALIKSTNPGSGEIQVESHDGKLASGKFLSQLSESARKRLKAKKTVRVNIEVEEKGNLIIIKSIEEITS